MTTTETHAFGNEAKAHNRRREIVNIGTKVSLVGFNTATDCYEFDSYPERTIADSPVPNFLDAETAGGDELRACTPSHLARLLADAMEAIEAERATLPVRTGRDLKAANALIFRTVQIADRLHYYVGVKIAHGPTA